MRDNQHPLPQPRVALALLGRFALRIDGHTVDVPDSGARLLAALALQSRPTPRAVLAELLWPERAPDRSRANLRSVIWRLPGGARELVREQRACLELDRAVEVDVDVLIDRCRHLIHAPPDPAAWTAADADAVRWGFGDEDLLVDLLPTWDEDWVLADRARLRQVRLHALEALAELLVRSGRLTEAVDAAAAALRHEPLRETAAVALVSAHLAGGNVAEAHRVFRDYRDELHRELGLEPSSRLLSLLPEILPRGVTPTTTR
jgi:DNA-binding SARP family transcriptional activator